MNKRMLILTAVLAAAIGGWSLWRPPAGVHAQTGYNLTSVKGTYGFTERGTFGPTTPQVSVGVLVADGAGGLTGSQVFQVYNSGSQNLTFQGTYTVNTNGTGTMTLLYPAQTDSTSSSITQQASLAKYSFVIVNNKTELQAVRSENGAFVTSTFKLQ